MKSRKVIVGNNLVQNSSIRWMLGLTTCLALGLFSFYALWGLPMQFFRAESVVWLINAHKQNPDELATAIAGYFKSYTGHFIPLFFLQEHYTARILGPNETGWFVRQLLAVIALAVSMATLLSKATKVGMPPSLKFWSAGTLAWIFVTQPIMFDMFAWPFMFAQMLCLIFGSWSLVALFSFGKNLRPRMLLVSALLAYASLNSFGVGIIFCAMVISIGSLWTVSRRKRLGGNLFRQAVIWLVGLLILCAAHARLMNGGNGGNVLENTVDKVWLWLGLLPTSLHYTMMAIFGCTGFPMPNAAFIKHNALYGVMGLVGAICFLIWKRKSFLAESGQSTKWLGVLSLGGFCLYCLLPALRSGEPDQVVCMLFGARYLFFSSYFVLLGLGILLNRLALGPRRLQVLYTLLLLGCTAGSIEFRNSVAPTLWPLISHQAYSEKLRYDLVDPDTEATGDDNSPRERAIYELSNIHDRDLAEVFKMHPLPNKNRSTLSFKTQSGDGAFSENHLPLELASPPLSPRWGSYDPVNKEAAKGTLQLTFEPSPRTRWIEFFVAGQPSPHGSSLIVSALDGSHRTPISFARSPGMAWESVIAKVPEGKIRLEACDKFDQRWFAFTAPRPVGRWQIVKRRMLQHGGWRWLITGVGLMTFLGLHVWCARMIPQASGPVLERPAGSPS